jgi:hypothetical protein
MPSTIPPVPFRLAVPSHDRVGFSGALTTEWKLQGLLHHDGEVLTIEWTGTQKTEGIAPTGVVQKVEHLPPEAIDVPLEWITGAALTGGWWWPRLVLRASRLDAFDGVPGAGAGVLALKLRRADLELARGMADAINDGPG